MQKICIVIDPRDQLLESKICTLRILSHELDRRKSITLEINANPDAFKGMDDVIDIIDIVTYPTMAELIDAIMRLANCEMTYRPEVWNLMILSIDSGDGLVDRIMLAADMLLDYPMFVDGHEEDNSVFTYTLVGNTAAHTRDSHYLEQLTDLINKAESVFVGDHQVMFASTTIGTGLRLNFLNSELIEDKPFLITHMDRENTMSMLIINVTHPMVKQLTEMNLNGDMLFENTLLYKVDVKLQDIDFEDIYVNKCADSAFLKLK